MKKSAIILCVSSLLVLTCLFYFKDALRNINLTSENEKNEEGEEYENLMEKYAQEFEQMRDPSTNTVPNNRLLDAVEYTRNQRRMPAARTNSLNWVERAPIY